MQYVYTDRDGTGVQDPAMRAYGCCWVGQTCEREQGWPWYRGKALVRFPDGTRIIVRARLLRRVK